MSTNFTIISKESDFQQLLSKLKDKGIELQLPSSDTSYSSDNNHSFKNQINDSDEYIDFCIFKTFSLLLDSIRSNVSPQSPGVIITLNSHGIKHHGSYSNKLYGLN